MVHILTCSRTGRATRIWRRQTDTTRQRTFRFSSGIDTTRPRSQGIDDVSSSCRLSVVATFGQPRRPSSRPVATYGIPEATVSTSSCSRPIGISLIPFASTTIVAKNSPIRLTATFVSTLSLLRQSALSARPRPTRRTFRLDRPSTTTVLPSMQIRIRPRKTRQTPVIACGLAARNEVHFESWFLSCVTSQDTVSKILARTNYSSFTQAACGSTGNSEISHRNRYETHCVTRHKTRVATAQRATGSNSNYHMMYSCRGFFRKSFYRTFRTSWTFPTATLKSRFYFNKNGTYLDRNRDTDVGYSGCCHYSFSSSASCTRRWTGYSCADNRTHSFKSRQHQYTAEDGLK